jgi:hypothetical protein
MTKNTKYTITIEVENGSATMEIRGGNVTSFEAIGVLHSMIISVNNEYIDTKVKKEAGE